MTAALILAGLYVGGLAFVVALCRGAARGDQLEQATVTDADIAWLAQQAEPVMATTSVPDPYVCPTCGRLVRSYSDPQHDFTQHTA